jgi:hypothetical protein
MYLKPVCTVMTYSLSVNTLKLSLKNRTNTNTSKFFMEFKFVYALIK